MFNILCNFEIKLAEFFNKNYLQFRLICSILNKSLFFIGRIMLNKLLKCACCSAVFIVSSVATGSQKLLLRMGICSDYPIDSLSQFDQEVDSRTAIGDVFEMATASLETGFDSLQRGDQLVTLCRFDDATPLTGEGAIVDNLSFISDSSILRPTFENDFSSYEIFCKRQDFMKSLEGILNSLKQGGQIDSNLVFGQIRQLSEEQFTQRHFKYGIEAVENELLTFINLETKDESIIANVSKLVNLLDICLYGKLDTK